MSTGRLYDITETAGSVVTTTGEYQWFAAHSGLTPQEQFSLADHQRAYFFQQVYSSNPAYNYLTLDDLRWAYYMQQAGLPTPTSGTSIGRLEYMYFSSVSGLTPPERYSLRDHKIAFYGV